MSNVTFYKNIFRKEAKDAYVKSVDYALERIKTGNSRENVMQLRSCLDKEKRDKQKQYLPCVLFSGEFGDRLDKALKKHSGFICLDFDNVADISKKYDEITSKPFVYACWISPSGKGVKALVKIADGSKHRAHFQALQEVFPDIDPSGVNESRVCYESYDPDIYIYPDCETFTKVKTYKVEKTSIQVGDKNEIFQEVLKWLTNRGDAFQQGERNYFIFKLSSACCRHGIPQDEANDLIVEALNIGSSEFTLEETKRAIDNGYKSNKEKFGKSVINKDILVDTETGEEVEFEIPEELIKPKDVIYGEDVKADALRIYHEGYEKVFGINCEIDEYFKLKTGDLTLLSGIGNYGKSSFLKWFLLNRVILYGEKFAFYSPEDLADEFYHDCAETFLADNCTPTNPYKPPVEAYDSAYDYAAKHVFYVYPKHEKATPEYILERFLELAIKEKISGCIVDPFNQMDNDYNGVSGARSDKYLENMLPLFSRFAKENKMFFIIIAHPKQMPKQPDGNYPCPDVFDIADGAMWNNKMDNIIVYHRPVNNSDPQNPFCQLHSKKIRRQKVVGKKGSLDFKYLHGYRRFMVNDVDVLEENMKSKKIFFGEEAPF